MATTWSVTQDSDDMLESIMDSYKYSPTKKQLIEDIVEEKYSEVIEDGS